MAQPDKQTIREGLLRAGWNHKGGRRMIEQATESLREWAALADEAGTSRSEIARLAGVSREGLYFIMKWGGRS